MEACERPLVLSLLQRRFPAVSRLARTRTRMRTLVHTHTHTLWFRLLLAQGEAEQVY